MTQLDELRKRFPTAPYAFFRVRNAPEAMQEFLDGKVSEPRFTYGPKLNQPALLRRKRVFLAVRSQPREINQTLQDFVDRRLLETELLLQFLALRKKPGDAETLRRYRMLIERLYGGFDEEVVRGTLGYLSKRAKETKTTRYFEEIKRLVRFTPAQTLFSPSSATFAHYQNLLFTSSHPLTLLKNRKLGGDHTEPQTIEALFAWALDECGATAAGWRLRWAKHGSNVMISLHSHEVILGRHYVPQSAMRLRQVVGHEIFLHVRRALLHQHHQSPAVEEGVAIVVEQLLDRRFVYRRLLRYLAAALAWGVDGRPRTFSETFEIIWRAVVIVGNIPEQDAKRRAFRECTRIFRGGVPEVAGAAFIKDKVYFEANLAVWQRLENATLSKDEFLKFLDGYEM